jgi:hypothetical protein
MAKTKTEPMRIRVQEPGDQSRHIVGDLIYVKGDKKFTYVEKIDAGSDTIHERVVSHEDLRKLLLTAQEENRKREFTDSEGIDHKALLNDILKHVDSQENNIQVLDGGIDTVKLEHFPCDTVGSVIELIHFIEVNELTEKRPWSAFWNLYKCMLIAAKR